MINTTHAFNCIELHRRVTADFRDFASRLQKRFPEVFVNLTTYELGLWPNPTLPDCMRVAQIQVGTRDGPVTCVGASMCDIGDHFMLGAEVTYHNSTLNLSSNFQIAEAGWHTSRFVHDLLGSPYTAKSPIAVTISESVQPNPYAMQSHIADVVAEFPHLKGHFTP